MSHKNQSGFIMMAVVTVVVIAVLGLIGWSLYSHYYAKQNSVTTSGQSSKPATPTPAPTPQPTYLDIKELGVRIKLDDSIKDAIYTAHTKIDGSQFVDVSTQTLTNKSNGSCSPDNGSIAAVGKTSGTPEQVFSGPGIDPVNNSTTFKFGTDTYVYISGPQQICSEDKTVQDLANQQRATFFNDFKTVQLYSSTLDIKELGIKITLNDQIDDAVYAPFDNPYTDKTKTMGISAQSLISKDANCSASRGTIGVVSALTTAPTYVNSQRILPVDDKSLFKFGNTYYFYQRPQAQGCLTIAQADTDLVSSKINAFAQAFATAQLDSTP